MEPFVSGVRVEERAELGGRALVASRAFAAYEVVLAEAPLLEWRQGADGGASFLDAAAAADARVAQALQAFARPPLDADVPRVREQAAAAARWLAARGGAAPPGWAADTAHALLLVADTNTHSFSGVEAEADTPAAGGKRLGLFELASKAAHSCAPNCVYSSRLGRGLLHYVATRPLAEGEAITFSYLAEEVATPRAARRAELLQTKFFHCRCGRCAGRDDCRGLRCGSCARGTLLCADAAPEEAASWACARCGAPPAPAWLEAQLRAETQLVARYRALEAALHSGEALRRGPGDLAALAKLAAGALAPTHWLVAAATQLRVTWAASQRVALVQSLGRGRPGGPPPVVPAPWGGELVSAASFSAAAGAAGIELMRCCECIWAGCVGGDACPAAQPPPGRALHPPAPGALHVALWAVQDLRASDGAAEAQLARTEVAPRYLSLLRAQFGDDDDDVRDIAAWLAKKP